MTFIVTKSAVDPEFYIVDRRPDTPSPLHPAHLDCSDDESPCFNACIYPVAHAPRDLEPILFGDIDTVDDLLTRTSFGKDESAEKRRGSEMDDSPPPQRRRRNAISTFLDGLF